MFDINQLIRRICCGEATVVRLNGRTRPLADANAISVEAGRCSGTIGIVHFSINHREEDGRFIFSLTLHNAGARVVRVGDITMFTHSENRLGGRRLNRCVYEFRDSLLSENYVEKASAHKGVHRSRPMGLIYDLDSGLTFFAGQLRFEKNMADFEAAFAPECNRLEFLKCVYHLDDYYLEPDREVTTDEICVDLNCHKTPRTALYGWADAVNAICQPRISGQIPAGFLCGWLISTKAEPTDSQIRRQIAAASSLKRLGLTYCWISIDNLKDGMPGNWLLDNRDNFSDGVEATMKEISAAGFKPGLWVGPDLITERSADLEKMWPHLMMGKDGQPRSLFRWYWGTLDAEGNLPRCYNLEPSDSQAIEYIGNVLETYAKWGVRYHMLDFLSEAQYGKSDIHHGFDQEHYRKFMRSLRKHTADDAFVISAVGSSCGFIGCFDSARIGMDYGEARQLEPNFESYPANYLINGSFGSCGSPNRNAITNLAMWGFAHNRFFQCNSNMMTVDLPIPLNEAQISATLFGISPSPVFFSDDFARMAPSRLDLLKKVLPRCPGMPEAADLFTKTDGRTDFTRIFKLRIRKDWGEWDIVAVFNLNEEMRTVELKANMLDLEEKISYWMYDFWGECYMGQFRNARCVDVPAMSCRLFRFARVQNHPWVLSTDMHVRQGDCELSDVKWDAEKMTLSGKATRAVGERGNLLIASTDDWMEAHFNRGMLVAKSAYDNGLVIKVPLEFSADTMEWSVEFKMSDSPYKQQKRKELE